MDALNESAEKNKAAALVAQVVSHGIPVENLDIVVDDDAATVYGQVESTTLKEKVILIVGNTEGIATVDDRLSVINNEPEATFYTVQKGDSLLKIAKEHYGDMMKYPVIFEANKPMLTSPDLICSISFSTCLSVAILPLPKILLNSDIFLIFIGGGKLFVDL